MNTTYLSRLLLPLPSLPLGGTMSVSEEQKLTGARQRLGTKVTGHPRDGEAPMARNTQASNVTIWPKCVYHETGLLGWSCGGLSFVLKNPSDLWQFLRRRKTPGRESDMTISDELRKLSQESGSKFSGVRFLVSTFSV